MARKQLVGKESKRNRGFWSWTVSRSCYTVYGRRPSSAFQSNDHRNTCLVFLCCLVPIPRTTISLHKLRFINYLKIDGFGEVFGCVQPYTNVSIEELEKYKDCVCRGMDLDWCDRVINWHARFLHEDKEKVKPISPAPNTGSLIYVVSVRVQPKEEVKSLAIYGKIEVEFPDFNYGGIIGHEFYKRDHNTPQFLNSFTYWVALPAHSFLVGDLVLLEFETGRKTVNDTMKFLAQLGGMNGNTFVLDDLFIEVSVAWFTPSPMGPQYEKFSCNTEEIPMEEDIDGEDEFSCNTEEIPMEEDIDGEDESSSDESPSNLNCTWGLRSHTNKPWPSHAVEIFSVFIGQEMSKALQTRNLRIYGSIEVVYDDDRICSIFKRDVNCALELLEPMKSTIDVLDGSRAYEECSLEIKLDIKDVEDRLAIKGYVDWEASVLEKSLWRDKQLCNVFQGQNGFAAVHYSIFSEAVQAAIKVSINFKMGDGPQKACGSLIAQYNCFDYSSRYNKEYYRIVLFRRIEEDSVGLNADSTLPLSRSVVVVPAYSSLVIDADLDLSGQKILCTKEIEIGEGYKTIETNDCVIHFELAWCEIK